LNEIKDSIVEMKIDTSDGIVAGRYFTPISLDCNPPLVDPIKFRSVDTSGIFFPVIESRILYGNQDVSIKDPEGIYYVENNNLNVLAGRYIELGTGEKAVRLLNLNNKDIRVRTFTLVVRSVLKLQTQEGLLRCMIL
jgi:hypothetical protein